MRYKKKRRNDVARRVSRTKRAVIESAQLRGLVFLTFSLFEVEKTLITSSCMRVIQSSFEKLPRDGFDC
jgi:hypothetical protein